MNKNVAAPDRTVRIVIGLGLISAAFLVQDSYRWVGLLGLVLLVTGIVGNCPLYSVLGLNERATKPKP